MTKRNRKLRIVAIRAGVAPTPERRKQHGGVITEVVDRDISGKVLVKRYRAAWECPLDAYRNKGLIGQKEYAAGLIFRQAYFSSVLSKAAAYSRTAIASNTRLSIGEKILRAAYRKLSPHNKGSIIDICGHDLPAQDYVKLDRLKNGLGELAELWQAAAKEVCDH